MGLFEKIKKAVGCGPVVNVGADLTNQRIMDIMAERFDWEIKYRSAGNRMVYPMTFTVVMHNKDFQGRMVEFQMLMPEVVQEFYKIILKYSDKYNNYINPANYWTFRFIPSMSEDMELDGVGIHVEEGNIVIIASILDITETDNSNNSLNVSMPVDKTGVVKKTNINLAAFGKFVGTDQPITVDWTNPVAAVNGSAVSPLAPHVINPGAKETKKTPSAGPSSYSGLSDLEAIFGKGNDTYQLAYKLNDNVYTYVINSAECWVCGEGADDTKPDTFVVKSNNVKSPHMLVRKDMNDGKYYLAAFAPTSINEVQIPVSTPGKPKWVTLDANVNIKLNSFVIRFMKKH